MYLKKKLWILALAGAMPWAAVHAQSVADLKKEIDALKAQLQVLQQKVEAVTAQPEVTPLSQQVNRLEQRLDLAEDDKEKAGFKGLKVNGVIEAAYKYNNIDTSHTFSAGSGAGGTEVGMLQITKESQDGEGVDWTLRLLPGGDPLVHEASLSIPLNKDTRIIAGLIPDFQGYEMVFANANATLGNQLISHNALYDLAGATVYAGAGMSYTMGGGKYAFKWLIGNADSGADNSDTKINLPAYDATGAMINSPFAVAVSKQKTKVLAYRGDWYIDETRYIGLSGLHGTGNRSFNILAMDGGVTRGDWQINGQATIGRMDRAAANGQSASWQGFSGLLGYKIVPRLQVLARADYILNSEHGGGTYYDNGGTLGNGLGPERSDTAGNFAVDADGFARTGANLMRLTLGTNYQINANTQWKAEFRLDQSSGYNFLDGDGVTYRKDKQSMGTSLVLSF